MKFRKDIVCFNDKLNENLGGVVFALTFVITGIANIIPIYLGWSYEGCLYADYCSRAILILFGLAMYYCGLKMLKRLVTNRSQKKAVVLLIGFYIFFYVRYLIEQGADVTMLLLGKRFLGLMVPAFIAGFYSGQKDCSRFCTWLERMSILYLPLMTLYVLGYFGIETEFGYKSFLVNNLGLLDYGAIAYIALPFVVAHIIGGLEDGDRGRGVIRFVFIVLYQWGIIITGCRGAEYLLLVVVLLVTFASYRRGSLLRVTVLVSTIFGLFFSGLFFSHTLMGERTEFFVNGMKSGNLVTSHYKSNNRGDLYREAWNIFLDHPAVGIGMNRYPEVSGYNKHPHNPVLELFCETGLIGVLWLLFVFWFIPWRHKAKAANNKQTMIGDYVNIFLFMYAMIFLFVQGQSIWTSYSIMAVIGFLISRYGEDDCKEGG